MRQGKSLAAMALSAVSFWPIDLGYIALSSLVIQCRTAKDIYISTDPLGTNYLTLKSGTSMSLDLEGGVLDVSEGSDLVYNGTFTGNADGWTYNDAVWSYTSNAMNKDAGGTAALSQVSDGSYMDPLVAGAVYKLVYSLTVYGSGSAGALTPSVGGTNVTARTPSTVVTYTDYVEATNASGGVVFTPATGVLCTVDTVSLKRITFPGNQRPIYVKGSEAGLYLEMFAIQ